MSTSFAIGTCESRADTRGKTAARPLEQNNEWALERRQVTLETLATLGQNAAVRLPSNPA